MNFTVEDLDKVIEATGASYAQAKEALIQAEGDADQAIELLAAKAQENEFYKNFADEEEQAGSDPDRHANLEDLKRKVTDIIKEGRAKKIVVKRNGKEVVSVPLNLGLVGGIVGVAAAPAAVIIGAVAAYGLDCKIEVQKKDGTTEEV